VNPYASPAAYRENAVMTASPEQLVVMLYDGVGRFLRQAEASLGEGAWDHAHDRLNRGEAIVDELLATLDMDQGVIAERLQAIYVYCKRCLMEARVEREPQKIRLVIRLLGELREAWAQVAAAGTPA
jgi:flagellar secretion chaperone FliS